MKNGLKILILADAWASLALGMIGPIYAIFIEKIGGDILDVGWAYFVFTITSGLVLYIISQWENKIVYKERLIVLGYAINTLGCLLYFFTNSQQSLLIVQIVLGIGIAIVTPAFDSMYSHFVNLEKEASDWGAWEAMGYVVAGIASLIGSFIVHKFGFRVLFLLMSFASLIATVFSIFLFRTRDYLNNSKLDIFSSK
jgi:MFS family permease